ncbi:CK1/CK1/CK1-G protein kinase, partial [Aureobasidium melanogenum]
DYDYLRDLFTQALKNSGEVEDGEYDWMKLNNGKGWEAMKQHPSQAHLHAHHNNVANTSARDVHANRASKTPIPPGRLEQELPKPGAVRNPAQAQRQSGTNRHYSQDYAQKRTSQGGDLAPPEGSTAAQFANSSGNLPGRLQNTQPSRQSTTQPSAQAQRVQQQQQQQQPEQKPSGMSKFFKALCCG